MRYLLDTNIYIAYLNGRSLNVKRNFLQNSPSEIFLCSIVKAELIYGAMKSKKVEQNIEKLEQFFKQFSSLPFDDDSSKIYGKIRANLEKSGNIIGPNDLLIASVALANDMTLVTNNIGEFERVEGLKIVDWK
jgi:tRNA(fMet)-specific endonuclease VapC